jgi:selenocysteine lyase/cysteine desulfurase
MVTCKKDSYSLPPNRHYLNCAYMSPLSKRVEAAGVAGIRRKAMPADITPKDFFSGPDKVRELFAALIGVGEPRRIAIVPSVSYGVSTIAKNTRLAPSQNVVTLVDQFPSHVYPWRRLCREAGADLKVVDPGPAGPGRAERWNAALLEAIDAGTAVVAVPNVHWTDGTRFDLEVVGARARAVGAALIVDGTQSLGAMPFDVGRIQPDALVCAAYKWLGGPYSIGAAYFGTRYDDGVPLEEGWLPREGSEDFNRLVDYRDEYRNGAARYDVGEVSNFTLIPMFAAALEQLAEWGVDNVSPYCRRLTAELIADLGDAGFGVAEEQWRGGHLFGLRVPEGFDEDGFRKRLAAENVSVALRGNAIRVAPYLYNDQGDVQALRRALDL